MSSQNPMHTADKYIGFLYINQTKVFCEILKPVLKGQVMSSRHSQMHLTLLECNQNIHSATKQQYSSYSEGSLQQCSERNELEYGENCYTVHT